MCHCSVQLARPLLIFHRNVSTSGEQICILTERVSPLRVPFLHLQEITYKNKFGKERKMCQQFNKLGSNIPLINLLLFE